MSEATSVVFLRETAWDDLYQVNTNVLAEQFRDSGRWHVAWVTPPLHPGQIVLRRPRALRDARLWLRGGHAEAGLAVCAPMTLLPYASRVPLLDSEWVARWTWRFCVPPLPRTLRRLGCSAPRLLWSGLPFGGGLRDLFPGVPLIQHVTDFYTSWPGTPPALLRAERWTYSRADRVVATAESLRRRLVSDLGVPAEKITVIGPGVWIERYRGEATEPEDLAAIERPRIVTHGLLKKTRTAWIERLAARRPGWSFVLIGDSAPAVDALVARFPNVHHLGRKGRERLSHYLRCCDLGLILVGDDDAPERYSGMHPMKLYEYAAAGLPVVATPLEEYQYLACPVAVADSCGAAEHAIETALLRRAELGEAMRRFAADNAWPTKFAAAERLANDLIGARTPSLPGIRA